MPDTTETLGGWGTPDPEAPQPSDDWEWSGWTRGTEVVITADDGRTSLAEITQADTGPEIRLAERAPEPPPKTLPALGPKPKLPKGKVVKRTDLVAKVRDAGMVVVSIDGGMAILRATVYRGHEDTHWEYYGGIDAMPVLQGGDLSRAAVRAWIADFATIHGADLVSVDQHAIELSQRVAGADTVGRALTALASDNGLAVVVP